MRLLVERSVLQKLCDDQDESTPPMSDLIVSSYRTLQETIARRRGNAG